MLTYYDPQNASLMRRYLLLIFKGGNGMTNFGYDPERPDNPWEMLFAMVVIVFQLFLAAYILGKCLIST